MRKKTISSVVLDFVRNKGNVFHPFIFASFPVFSLYVNNAEKLHFREVMGVVLVVLVVAVLFWGLLMRIVHQPYKAALLTSMFWFLFFSYEHVINAVSYLFNTIGVLDRMRFLVRGQFADSFWLSLWGGLIFMMVFTILKYRGDLVHVNRLFNVVGVGIIVAVFTNWAIVSFRQPHNAIEDYIHAWREYVTGEELVEKNIQRDNLPDIYYIVMDGFAREDVLNTYYQIDTDEFSSNLEKLGFYIAGSSYANYHWTLFSLASSLNFIYLDDLATQMGPETISLTPPEAMIETNRLFTQLKLSGYRIVTFADQYAPTDITSSDVYISPDRWILNAFQNEVFNITPLPALFRRFALRSPYDLHRDQVEFTFTHLADPRELRGPSFVFAHIIAPHPPFVFGAHGEALRPAYNYSLLDGSKFFEDATREEYINGYRSQTIYVMERLFHEVENIISRNQRPVVIVIQADHGPGALWDVYSQENTDLHERMAIFNAYYFPDEKYENLYPEITPVNSFRVILNAFLNTDLALLPDRSYFFSLASPYLLVDVTEELE